MRILLFVVLFFSISTLTYAQRGGAGFHGGGGFVSGNRGSRSGFVRGGAFRGGFANPGFRRGFGSMRPGARFVFVPRNRFFFPRNRFFFPRNQFFFSFGGFSGFPIVTYPYGWASYPYSDDYGSNDYGNAPAPLSSQVDRQPDYYLIAFTDHTIRAVVHYWVEDDMIHWITRERQERQAPLSEIDRPFSEQLNRDRGIEFELP